MEDHREEESTEDVDEMKVERACIALCQKAREDKELEVHFMAHFKSYESVSRMLGEKKYVKLASGAIKTFLDFYTVQKKTQEIAKINAEKRKLEVERLYPRDKVEITRRSLERGSKRASDFEYNWVFKQDLKEKIRTRESELKKFQADSCVNLESLKERLSTEYGRASAARLPVYDIAKIRRSTEEAESESRKRRDPYRKPSDYQPVTVKPRYVGLNHKIPKAKENQGTLQASNIARVSLNSEVNLSAPPGLFLTNNVPKDQFSSFKEEIRNNVLKTYENEDLDPHFKSEAKNLHASEKNIRIPPGSYEQYQSLGLSERQYRDQNPYYSSSAVNNNSAAIYDSLKITNASNIGNLETMYNQAAMSKKSGSSHKKTRLSEKKSMQKLLKQPAGSMEEKTVSNASGTITDSNNPKLKTSRSDIRNDNE